MVDSQMLVSFVQQDNIITDYIIIVMQDDNDSTENKGSEIT